MKFSYKLLKQLVPKLPNAQKTAELLSLHLFESEVIGKDILEIDVLPNRYSDAACYVGLAKELCALLGGSLTNPRTKKIATLPSVVRNDGKVIFDVIVKTKLCNRMAARYFEDIKIKPSPKWMQDALRASGIQLINNLVDITNYVTLETGQPLHAFDFDKMAGGKLIVRPAKGGEKVTSLENAVYDLNPNNLVLADGKEPLDVAGIKGGKKAEITSATKNILLTAGSFDGVSIYKTSRQINLATDASIRFSHNISPELVAVGIARATQLIKELCGGKTGVLVDIYQNKPSRRLIKFDINRFNNISGLELKEKEALGYLKKLGFVIKDNLVEPPAIRTDISIFEDLVEEAARLHGYHNIKSQPPQIFMRTSEFEDRINFKDNIRKILISFGLDEVYNYSFLSAHDLSREGLPAAFELENPVSKEFAFLRPSLLPGLAKALDSNLRFIEKPAIFEIGRVFKGSLAKKELVDERLNLGMAIADKRGAFLEIKGAIDGLFEQLGIVDYLMKEDTQQPSTKLIIESDGKEIGCVLHKKDGKTALVEVDLDDLLNLVEGEKSYEPLPKFPSIMRDISMLVPQEIRFTQIMSLIENTAPKYLDDVDLIDFYEDEKFSHGNRSLTFRLVFLDRGKTLTDKEVDVEMKKITKILVDKLGVEIR
ncbi:MAG: phenylalanine--tRNA ligase subunit beta [Patescibacteria group bacterium]